MEPIISLGPQEPPPPPKLDRRASLAQRLSNMSLRAAFEEREPEKPKSKTKKNFLYYRVEKDGESWRYAQRIEMPGPQSDIEKRAKKKSKDGNVLSQLTKMGDHRRKQLDRLLSDTQEEEGGDWEISFLEVVKKKETRSTVQPLAMDVILSRITKPTLSRSKSRGKPMTGELIDVLDSGKSKSKDKSDDKKKDKDKKKDDDKKEDKDKDKDGDGDGDGDDPILLDPFEEMPLFDKTGKPRDEHGIIPFENAGLPAEIPRERPIGSKPPKRPKDKRDKIQDVGGPIDLGAGGVLDVSGILAGGGPLDTNGVITVGDELGREIPRGRGSLFNEVPRRSKSRRRASAGRTSNRSKSRSRQGSARYPNSHTRTYLGSSVGSTSSGESRYGFDENEYETSSRTSTHDSPRYEKEYRQHYRGPSTDRRRDSYSGDRVIIPERSVRYVQKPERDGLRRSSTHDNQLVLRRDRYDDYPSQPPPRSYRASQVDLIYPDEMPEAYQVRTAEDYQRSRVRDDYLDRRERNVQYRENYQDYRDQKEGRYYDSRRQQYYPRN